MINPRLAHHMQLDVCTSRAKYRQGRKFLAVKVYTPSSESSHLLIFGVPSLGLRDELRRLCLRYGDVLAIAPVVPGYEGEESFTETFHVQYKRAVSARFSKKHLDGRNFFGGNLHVCYAPEFESLSETRAKLNQRIIDVGKRTTSHSGSSQMFTERRQRHRNFLNTKQSICTSTSDKTTVDSNCIWKGNICKSDPRTKLRPAPNIVQTYGPQLPDKEWLQAGVRERKLLAAFPQALKPTTCVTAPTSSSKSDIVSSGTGSYKFLPRQISINRIVFLKRQNRCVDGVVENKNEIHEACKRKADYLDNADRILEKRMNVINTCGEYQDQQK